MCSFTNYQNYTRTEFGGPVFKLAKQIIVGISAVDISFQYRIRSLIIYRHKFGEEAKENFTTLSETLADRLYCSLN